MAFGSKMVYRGNTPKSKLPPKGFNEIYGHHVATMQRVFDPSVDFGGSFGLEVAEPILDR